MHTSGFRIAATIALTLSAALAHAQVTVEQQTIQVGPPGGGVGGVLQLPGGFQGMRQTKTGTGRIRGRVLSSDGSGPIRRAQVRISGPDIMGKASLTDVDGRFEFRDLPAGRFTLQAVKSGYVTVQYGQTRPFESGKPIELVDKQLLDNADISMPRGGVIAGRITDEFGDPVPDATVMAMRLAWSNGKRRLVPAASGRIAQTNDLGQYRIYGLPPGDYYVSGSFRAGAELPMMDLELMVSGAAAGGTSGSMPKTGYASTYYPGTTSGTEAQKIALAPGQESMSADFSLLPVRLAKVTGFVLSADGKPLEGSSVTATPASRDGLVLPPASGRSGKDGSFTLNSVPPGDYTLQARSVQVITSTQGDNMMVFRATAMAGPGGEQESGSVPLTVAGDDLANVTIVTSKGGTATGHVTFDGPRPPTNTIRITSMPIDSEGMALFGAAGLKEDGTFELKGLSGPRLIRVAAAPPGWRLKSVKLNGTDITDTGAEFKAGDVTPGLEIELSARTTSVSGGVTASDGTVLKDYTLVIFSEAAETWRYPNTRWVTGTRPDQDGRFKVSNLPAGTFIAVAVDYVPQGEWGDPELLERLKSKGKRFTLDDGGSQTIELKLTADY
jgi:hypothetical protein